MVKAKVKSKFFLEKSSRRDLGWYLCRVSTCQLCLVRRVLPSPYFSSDCPQSKLCKVVGSSSLSSSGSGARVFSISVRHCWDISIRFSNGGRSSFSWAKYGTTLKAATGLSNTEPSNPIQLWCMHLLCFAKWLFMVLDIELAFFC